MVNLADMTQEELDAHIAQLKAEAALLNRLKNPRLHKKPKDPEELARQVLRVRAKQAGRANRQARQAVERRVYWDDTYTAAVTEYCQARGLAELPEDLADELGRIWTYHDTPQVERDKLED